MRQITYSRISELSAELFFNCSNNYLSQFFLISNTVQFPFLANCVPEDADAEA